MNVHQDRDPLKFVWATQSRSGSQFLLQLSLKLLGREAWPQARISGSRRDGIGADRSPSFRDLFASDQGEDYVREHGLHSLKLEDPGIDGFAYLLARAFPRARWLASLRSLDDILISHHNIRKWGHNEDYVLRSFRGGIELLERLAEQRRLMCVKVDRPAEFDPERFADFHGKRVTSAFRELVDEWKPINNLDYQKAKWGEAYVGIPERPPEVDTLRERHPWIPDVERRYEGVWLKTR